MPDLRLPDRPPAYGSDVWLLCSGYCVVIYGRINLRAVGHPVNHSSKIKGKVESLKYATAVRI